MNSDDKKSVKVKRFFQGFLEKKGLKSTSQRNEILKFFLQTERHVSAEELYILLRQKNKRVGYSTIYRTLKLLSECNLAREINFGDGRTRFEHNYLHQHHDHLVCMSCGKTFEFHSKEIEAFQEKVAKEFNFKPFNHRMEIYGFCKECESNKK